MKQSTIYWIWLVGSLVWLINCLISWHAGHSGHALLSLVVALLFSAAAVQARGKGNLPD